MSRSILLDQEVALYADDSHELEVLLPVGAELERRGARVRTAESFGEAATIGIYSAHTSRFYDFDEHVWRRPPNDLMVQTVHDLGDGGAEGSDYFRAESWRIFDLGLLPGRRWMEEWQRAAEGGTAGPAQGMRVVGWPKMDHVHADPAAFAESVRALRAKLGLGERPAVLLACSWSDRKQLRDTMELLDPDEFDVVVKYPASYLPPPNSPWAERLTEAFHEMRAARAEAETADGVKVADDDTDIMALVAACDVVLSDGSNVLYEGILAGVPGICVVDWLHPAGRHGETAERPVITLPGVVSGELTSLPTMLRIVRDPVWQPLVRESADALVDPATRGTAAALTADAIEEAFARPERSQAHDPEAGGDDEPLVVVMRQLKKTEAERDDARAVLAFTEERERLVQEELDAARRELEELRGGQGRGARRLISRGTPKR